jgi:ribosomal protein S7
VFVDVLDAEEPQVEAEIRASGGDASYVHLDVTSESQWREAVGWLNLSMVSWISW